MINAVTLVVLYHLMVILKVLDLRLYQCEIVKIDCETVLLWPGTTQQRFPSAADQKCSGPRWHIAEGLKLTVEVKPRTHQHTPTTKNCTTVSNWRAVCLSMRFSIMPKLLDELTSHLATTQFKTVSTGDICLYRNSKLFPNGNRFKQCSCLALKHSQINIF